HDRDDTPVLPLDDLVAGLALGEVVHKLLDVFVRVDRERPGRHAVSDKVAQRATGAADIRREPVHLDVALIAEDEPHVGVEHRHALGHVVEDHVEQLPLTTLVHRRTLRSGGPGKGHDARAGGGPLPWGIHHLVSSVGTPKLRSWRNPYRKDVRNPSMDRGQFYLRIDLV